LRAAPAGRAAACRVCFSFTSLLFPSPRFFLGFFFFSLSLSLWLISWASHAQRGCRAAHACAGCDKTGAAPYILVSSSWLPSFFLFSPSPNPMLGGLVSQQGWLVKRGETRKTWRKRWFTLTQSTLRWYEPGWFTLNPVDGYLKGEVRLPASFSFTPFFIRCRVGMVVVVFH
jgi:hypothetical protein